MIMSPSDREQQERVFTISDIAHILKVSEQVVRKLIANEELRCKRVGRQYRVTQAMLDEYLSK